MDDDQRLRDLVTRGCDRRGWSPATCRTLYYTARTLMLRLGSFEAFCLAGARDVQSWLELKGRKANTAYNYLRHARTVYGFLVDEGVIDADPTAGSRVEPPSRGDAHQRPSASIGDLKMVFAHGKGKSDTLTGARDYLVLCLKVRCGVGYPAMAKCRVSDLELTEGGGFLLAPAAWGPSPRRALYRIDSQTAWAFGNYLAIRGPASKEDPLIAVDKSRGGGFYGDHSLRRCVNGLFAECGLRVSDFDLDKTMIEIAYAEGANVAQASTLTQGGIALALKVAEELPSADPTEIHRRLLRNLDPSGVSAMGLVKSEDIMAAVVPAYGTPYIKVIIGPDGWARFELPDNPDSGRLASP